MNALGGRHTLMHAYQCHGQKQFQPTGCTPALGQCATGLIIYGYCIAGFYREDFNIAFGSIRNIKIHVIFVNRNILWQVSHNHTSIIL